MPTEFKPINTQEDFDAAIKDRLARHTTSVTADVEKKYEGYISPDEKKKLTDQIDTLNTQLKEKETSITDLTAKNKAFETASLKAKIAAEKGIPYELANKLSGETEAEIKADAETFSKFLGSSQPTQPLFNPEKGGSGTTSSTDAALLSVLGELTN